MDNEKLEQRIRDLAGHAAPDKLGDILAACQQDARKGIIIDMNSEVKKRRPRWTAIVAVAAAVALICAAGFIGYGYGRTAAPTEDSVIMLDVNPSVSISVDAEEKVLAVTPLNADGNIVVGDMDFTGSSLDVTVNALIGMGLLEKAHRPGNNKNLFVTVTPKGRELYRDYSRFIYERWFRDIFKLADQIPEEHLKIFEDILQGFADTLV